MRTALSVLVALAVCASPAFAAYTVSFDNSTYTISQGSNLTVTLTYAATGASPGVQLQGADLLFNSGQVAPVSQDLSAVNWAPGAGFIFDSGNVTDSLATAAHPGYLWEVGVKNTFSIPPDYGSTNSAVSSGNLAQITYSTSSLAPGSYTVPTLANVDLHQFNGVNVSWSAITVDSVGNSATLTVTPEPAVVAQVLGLLGVAGPIAGRRVWRRLKGKK